MLYEYLCDNCGNRFEITQSIKADNLVHCDCCDTDSLSRVIYGGIMGMMGGVKTIGGLLEKGDASLGKYEVQEKRHEAQQTKLADKNAVQQQLAEKHGTTPIVYNEYTERKNAKLEKLNKMTTQQKNKYIKTGKGL